MLETKGLLTVEDLLGYAPFRYEDRSNVKTIAELAPGEVATVIAEVKSTKLTGFRGRNLGLVETIFTDPSGEMLRGNGSAPTAAISPTNSHRVSKLHCSEKSNSITTRVIC